MGKVFTITEGLENMGALKTGGQGSVYKGRRNGTTITAVKLMPTPIYSESREDKNYIDFQNEVEKLRKVNESPNPHVVTILNSGITETGNFPFIEMEFIEGPDLEELLKPPHEPVFSIAETVKVARHISDALAHCHRVGVKHGDIKTNNIKLNTKTGNYVLLDFGLATMSDEQRRTSLRHAGAIEFMAPEQNEGQLLFQSDIYSFGIILYELLAGRVPFPLNERSETARNTVMISHMEMQPPDLLQLRQQNSYQTWNIEKREAEMEVPAWLLSLVKTCLQKDPAARFEDGVALQQFVRTESSKATIIPAVQKEPLLHEPVERTPFAELPEDRFSHNRFDDDDDSTTEGVTIKRKRPVGMFLLVGFVVLALAGFAAYKYLGKDSGQVLSAGNTNFPTDTTTSPTIVQEEEPVLQVNRQVPSQVVDTNASVKADEYDKNPNRDTTLVSKVNKDLVPDTVKAAIEKPGAPSNQETSIGKYRVKSKAFFHNDPAENTRRKAFIVHWNNATLNALAEQNGFVYVIFTNHLGQTSKGWLRLQDLTKVD